MMRSTCKCLVTEIPPAIEAVRKSEDAQSSNYLNEAICSGQEYRHVAGLSTMEQQWIATKINSYLQHLPGQPAPQLPPPPSQTASRYQPVCTCC